MIIPKAMKKPIAISALLLMISFQSCLEDPQEASLRVLEENYPRAFFFRIPQFIEEPYEEWEEKYNSLMGIQAKVLEEELPGISDPNIEFFTRFKQNNPDQFVSLHYNGNSRDPRNAGPDFFAGHWLYFNGAEVLSDVPSEEGISEIRVSDVTLFKTGTGRYNNSNEDLGICELDAEGHPDWQRSEQLQLVSIDPEAGTITVRRGCYGTSPRDFRAGNSYIASHVHSGPWEEFGNLMWFYNHSTTCPRDPEGRNCTDVLVGDLASHFLEGGDLAAFDGIEFDVLFYDLSKHNFLWNYWAPGSNRAPDTNADGVSDQGVFDNYNAYGEGVMRFLRELRAKLGDDRLIMADHNSSAQQRAFGIISGIECEGWPLMKDYRMESWAGGINRNLFWAENARDPKMNYINHKWFPKMLDTVDIPISSNRIIMAVSCLTNMAIGEGFFMPEKEPGQSGPAIWDELVMGKANVPGWLGKPLQPAMRLAKQHENILGELSLQELMDRIESSDKNPASISLDDQAIKIEGRSSGDQAFMELLLKDLPCSEKGLTLFMTFTGGSLAGTSEETGRYLYVTPEPPARELPERWFTSYMNMKPFESAFYYTGLPEAGIDFRLKIEGSEAVWLHSLEAYAYPDAMVREFENGIVLANPAPYPLVFNLDKLFPGRRFQRLTGSSRQDPVINDGSIVKGDVILGAKDALFLISKK